MGAVSLLAIPAAFCGFGVVLYGLFARRRSTVVGVVASFIGLLTAWGSYSGFVEVHSTTWGVGYAAVALASGIVAAMHFRPGECTAWRRVELREGSPGETTSCSRGCKPPDAEWSGRRSPGGAI